MLEDLAGLAVGLDADVGLIGPEEGLHPGDGVGGVDHHSHQLRAEQVAQDAVDEVLVAVEQHRRRGGLGRLLDRLPLTQQRLKIIDQLLFGHSFRLCADQQAGARGLDQHPKSPQAVALVLAIDAAGDVHALAVGLEHQEAAGKGEVAGEPGPLAAGGLLHHLNQHLLAWLQKFGDAGTALLQPQRAEVGDMDETVLLALADVDEGGIDPGENILNGSEVDIADLIAALGHHQFIDASVAEHRGDPQLLGDDDLLGHGKTGSTRGALPPLGRWSCRRGWMPVLEGWRSGKNS